MLALLLIADASVCASEIDVLARPGAERRHGLREGGLGVLLGDLCEEQAAARADEHLADGEAFVLGAACRYWSLSLQQLDKPAMPA